MLTKDNCSRMCHTSRYPDMSLYMTGLTRLQALSHGQGENMSLHFFVHAHERSLQALWIINTYLYKASVQVKEKGNLHLDFHMLDSVDIIICFTCTKTSVGAAKEQYNYIPPHHYTDLLSTFAV